MALAAGRPAARQLDGGRRFPPPGAFQVAVADLVPHRGDGFDERGTQRVVGGLHDHIRSRSHQMDRRAEWRAVRQAALEVNPRLIYLQLGLQGLQFLLDHPDDGVRRIVVAVGECEFHRVGRVVVLHSPTLAPEKPFASYENTIRLF